VLTGTTLDATGFAGSNIWNAGTVTTIGSGITLAAGTITSAPDGVTSIVSGAGLHAGTITGTGTLLADWNGGTVAALGTGVSLAGGTLSATGSGGSVTSVVAGPGLHAGTITAAGTLLADWNAGTVTTIGSGVTLTSGTLTSAADGVTSVVAGAGLHAGTISTTGTLLADWNGGTVSTLGNGIALNSGTISADTQGTIAATATGTINPAGLQSCLVNMGTVDTTLQCSPGYVGQHLRMELKQGATAHVVTLGTTFAFGLDITSYTATATASARDLLQLICVDGTHWAVAAVNHGFSV
jgi:hypothetical protein